MNKKLFITGVKHCGKSTVGRGLSKELGLPFFDLDDLIENSVKMSVRDFFKKEGRESFFEEESKAIDKLLNSGLSSFICATGGGICDNQAAFKKINSSGITLYINEEFEIIYERVIRGGIPAFLKGDNPKMEFQEIYSRRAKLYLNSANISIKAQKRLPKEIIKELNKELINVWE